MLLSVAAPVHEHVPGDINRSPNLGNGKIGGINYSYFRFPQLHIFECLCSRISLHCSLYEDTYTGYFLFSTTSRHRFNSHVRDGPPYVHLSFRTFTLSRNDPLGVHYRDVYTTLNQRDPTIDFSHPYRLVWFGLSLGKTSTFPPSFTVDSLLILVLSFFYLYS